MKGTWKTVKQAGVGTGARVRAKTISGLVVDAILDKEIEGRGVRRWYATNQSTGKEVQVTKVFVADSHTSYGLSAAELKEYQETYGEDPIRCDRKTEVADPVLQAQMNTHFGLK